MSRALLVCLLFSLTATIAGCAGVRNVPGEERQLQEYRQELEKNSARLPALVAQVKSGADDVDYGEFRDFFLSSSQIFSVGDARDLFESSMSNVGGIPDGNTFDCVRFPIDEILALNVFSYSALSVAIDCYTQTQQVDKASQYRNLLKFMLTGVFSSGSGEHYYDAYEIGAWFEAEELIEFTGFELIDSYYEFIGNANALYRAFLVWDPDQERQRTLYFNNLRFLYAVLGVEFPFAPTSDFLYQQVILSIKDWDAAAQNAVGAVLAEQNQFAEAEAAYLKAIELGSVSANVGLGKLCLAGHSETFQLAECPQLFVTAAELRLESAKVFLAFMAYSGRGMDRDPALADQLLESIVELQPGEAEFLMSQLLVSGTYIPVDKVGAEEFLHRAREKGYPNGLFWSALADGDPSSAAEALAQAARAGFAPAEFELARRNLQEAASRPEAIASLEGLARRQYPDALFLLGQIHEFGDRKTSGDYQPAVDYYQRAAYKGHTQAQFRLGLLYGNGDSEGIPTDYERANRWYYTCAILGNLDCITNLGFVNERGRGVEKNEQAAAELYQIAVDQDFPRATYNLGKLYEEGRGVEKDLHQALDLFHRAAELGDGWASNSVGIYYLRGSVVNKDYELAFHFFEQSAARGYEYGYYNLARMYQNGWGVEVDPVQAIANYEAASARGHSSASMTLGEFHRDGKWVEKNMAKAYMYFTRALKDGESEGRRQRELMCASEKCDFDKEELTSFLAQ